MPGTRRQPVVTDPGEALQQARISALAFSRGRRNVYVVTDAHPGTTLGAQTTSAVRKALKLRQFTVVSKQPMKNMDTPFRATTLATMLPADEEIEQLFSDMLVGA
jgi:hypothetical protein